MFQNVTQGNTKALWPLTDVKSSLLCGVEKASLLPQTPTARGLSASGSGQFLHRNHGEEGRGTSGRHLAQSPVPLGPSHPAQPGLLACDRVFKLPSPLIWPPTLRPGDPSILHGLQSQQQIKVELEGSQGPRAALSLSPRFLKVPQTAHN